ncbi:uncharacterized protein LAESUDRAFT_721329 [Laetiporus sulphureus 93-53]|uniref:Uncharacterized protein n=1 Tax=Laetiporus sulphureus 93-53 TaxID=1314785 RepID=A0A165GWL3_9APHY|nr:uncharacterized protein LAESUDRAFT_721329 [Laetiporus sulphureus 93-53]KZT10925.1 hypothetical protein LAESUDRAFT_721329 [Laetiporus sulphureus 93-53]
MPADVILPGLATAGTTLSEHASTEVIPFWTASADNRGRQDVFTRLSTSISQLVLGSSIPYISDSLLSYFIVSQALYLNK